MNHNLFLKYLKEYTLEALEQAGDDVPIAAEYLEKMKPAGVMAKNRAEKNAALERVRKIFSSSRERSLLSLIHI